MILPVILSGGSGSRLWPLSREFHPKQFLPLISQEHSLLQDTLLRLQGISDLLPPMVICHEQQRFLVAEQLRQIEQDKAQIVLEPCGRNTAPATTVAALIAQQQATAFPTDPLLLVMPADHLLDSSEALYQSINAASAQAMDGAITCFGVTPSSPETGYGYIQKGEPVNGGYQVSRFVEKPPYETAKSFLHSGDYLWNSGIFLFQAGRWLEEVERYQPDILKHCQLALASAKRDLDFLRLDSESYENSPSESIDYAVMEKTTHARVVTLATSWRDVGSWSALWETAEKDSEGNVCQGDVKLAKSRDCYIHAQQRLVTALGLDNTIVVETADAVLVADKAQAQSVKSLVETLKLEERVEASSHPQVYRPWGFYQCIEAGDRFKIKLINVQPGKQLSLQQHRFRAEHWVVVQGRASVTCGDEHFEISADQSTYIPLGQWHQLANHGNEPLIMVEVQTGDYLDEEDITRA